MAFAPIIIPTLNRVTHLKRCIESLQKNLWVEKTPLIISVDYPTKSEHEEGYREVIKFLNSGIDGFRSVEIIYQKENHGAIENGLFLLNYIRDRYEYYIFSEDDNEFSPYFIQYMNECLEKYKDNEQIVAICSMSRLNDSYYAGNVYSTPLFLAYGYGAWFHKNDDLQKKICNRTFYTETIYSVRTLLYMADISSQILFSLQSIIYDKDDLFRRKDGSVPFIDVTISIYNILEQTVCIYPSKSLSKNWGYDGSGANCKSINRFALQQELSDH